MGIAWFNDRRRAKRNLESGYGAWDDDETSPAPEGPSEIPEPDYSDLT